MEIYCDNAATTALDPQVLETMMPYLTGRFGNPSSAHRFGREAREALENARRTVAILLNASPEEIYFTSGATEANNMALSGSIQCFSIRHIITSRIEHQAVLRCLEHHHRAQHIRLSFVDTDSRGNLNLGHLDSLLQNNPASLVSLMHANNEIGNLSPLEEIGAICKRYRTVFHSDTVQTMGKQFYNLKRFPLHFVVGSAHKFHGPKGAGFLYVNKKLLLQSLVFGGSQERGLRSGTENVAGIIGLAKALELSYYRLEEDKKHLSSLKTYFVRQLKATVDNITFNGESESTEYSLPHIVNVCFPALPGKSLLNWLDLAGIAVSGGSACSTGHGSHVLKALQADVEKENIRFSFSRYNTLSEIDEIIGRIAGLFKEKQHSLPTLSHALA
jgi:cysteine desulfurase